MILFLINHVIYSRCGNFKSNFKQLNMYIHVLTRLLAGRPNIIKITMRNNNNDDDDDNDDDDLKQYSFQKSYRLLNIFEQAKC